jgi:hypothetical protein
MTISSVLRRAGPFNGNGSTTVFAREFVVLDADHLKVYQTISGVTTEVTTGISKDGIGTSAGNVTFSAAPATGTQITLLREIPLVQETDYSNQGKVEPERVEDDFDLQVMQTQDTSETLGRALRLPITSALTDPEVPDPISGKTIVGKADGDGWETGPSTTEIAGANASGITAAADRVQTGLDRAAVAADLVATNQDTIDTAADVVLTGADVTTTAQDALDTAADVLLTNADVVTTNADASTTTQDAIDTAADVVSTNADAATTTQDALDTAADVVSTNADAASTAQDALDTAADLVATNQDTIDTAANAVSTAQDAIDTAADLAATNQDAIDTAADLVATNQDTIDTAADAATTTQDAIDTAADVVLTNADVASTAALYDSFDDRYLGPKDSAPTLDNDGNAILEGAIYWNTTTDNLFIRNGASAWVAAAFDTSGALIAANNLSDVENAGTSRGNLGVAIGSDVQAYDADTLKSDVTANLTAAYTAAVDDDGTQSSGTYTPSAATGSNYKKIVGGGAFTLAPPALATGTATTLSLFIINNASAGAITTSGFTKVAGDAFTTIDGNKFSCTVQVTDIGGTEYSSLIVLAMQ